MDVGNIVHATDTTGLVVITQLQPISVIFTLPQDQLPQVMAKLHASATQLPVEAWDRDDTARIAGGKLATIDNQIDVTTGTYKLKAVFSNEKNDLFPNQFVNVHLLVDTKCNVTLVPVAAIQRGPQGTYVYTSYVAPSGNVVKIQPVTIAQTTGNLVGIANGVKAGDNVVVDGQDKLQDGTVINPTQAPMPALAASPTGTVAPETPAPNVAGAKPAPASAARTAETAAKPAPGTTGAAQR